LVHLKCGIVTLKKGDEQTMSIEKYDLIIIGAGTVGFDGMREALAHGVKKILMIEKNKVGGTCINRG
jgi:pyruvate/2-oxoglutarate dehydrogenase complex dihydrolipoamide dehydrogenase (E3) component